jgi:hypothetical protein
LPAAGAILPKRFPHREGDMTKCSSCIQGPIGIAGHPDLYVATMSSGPMQFKCRSCGALWMRDSRHGLEWTDAVGNELGSTVPQTPKKVVA